MISFSDVLRNLKALPSGNEIYDQLLQLQSWIRTFAYVFMADVLARIKKKNVKDIFIEIGPAKNILSKCCFSKRLISLPGRKKGESIHN